MKILMVNGQNHKGSTYHIGRILAEKITSAENISEIFLPRDFGEFCCGCNNCFTEDEKKCPHYEKLRCITEQIDDSELLIFTTPTYVFHATGQMKALLDHYAYRWMVHRPEEKMFRKKAVIISTAAGMGMKSAIKDIADSCFFWGIPRVYKYGKAVMETSWDNVSDKIKRSIELRTDRLAKKIKSTERKKLKNLKTMGLFSILRIVQKKGVSEIDREYWNKKGWTKNVSPWK